MSFGRFQIEGYTISNFGSQIQIHSDEKDLSLRIAGAFETDEPLQITVISEIEARVETQNSIMRLRYIEDEDEPNGQIEIDVKIPGDQLDSWTTLLNGVPREVIRVFILVLNGDDEAEDFRFVEQQNNNNNNNNSNFGNNNNNNSQRTLTNNEAVSIRSKSNNLEGGKRKRRQRKTQRRRR